MKKMICLVLVLICVFTIAAPAFADSIPRWGTVKVESTWLNVRKNPEPDATIIAYLKNGDRVKCYETYGTGYMRVVGNFRSSHSSSISGFSETAYGMDSEIMVYEQTGYVYSSYIHLD